MSHAPYPRPSHSNRQPLLTRREALFAGAAAGFTALLDYTNVVNLGLINQPAKESDATKPDVAEGVKFAPVFSNETAESIVKDLSLTPGAYFMVNGDTMAAMRDGEFKHAQEVSPILPPAVRVYEEKLKEAADEAGLPVNFLAVLATIESAGDDKAVSGADAWGLVQVVPRYHLDKFVNKGYLPAHATIDDYNQAKNGQHSDVSIEEYRRALSNPEASLRVGAEFLKQCLETARRNQPSLDPESPIVYAWAAAAYNGGEGVTQGPYHDMPQESQLYVNHAIRLLIDVEIAARLSKGGMSNDEVVAAMWSEEMNARAYAFDKLSYIKNYDDRAQLLTTIVPGVAEGQDGPVSPDGEVAQQAYQAYRTGKAEIAGSDNNRYTIPASPGLRIWMAGGGLGLFAKMSANAEWRLPK